MNKLFDPAYIFASAPGDPNLLFWRLVIGFGVLAIIVSVVALIIRKRDKKDGLKSKLWNRWIVWGFTVGPIIMMLAFFRFQNAYFLSMRLWIFAWLLFAVIRLAFILKYWFLDMPKKIKLRSEDQAFRQYLPSKK